ncbi:hypothetical protein Tco_1117212, partial [Tanacetum coccineum]
QGVSVWEGAEEVQSIIHIKAEKCKNMKHSQDMQLIQKLRDDQKCMKKVFEVMSGRNIVTNSRVTPSWREIVSLTFSEAGVLHVNWISFGHCVLRRVFKGTLGLELVLTLGIGMYEHVAMNHDSSGISCTNRREYLQGFAAALAVLFTGASQSRQHESHHRFFPVVTSLIQKESHKSPTMSLFDVDSSRISIFIVNEITRMFWQNHKDNA